MEIKKHSHRHAEAILRNVPEYVPLWNEIQATLDSITEQKMIDHFREHHEGQDKQTKSLSKTINDLIYQGLNAKTPKELMDVFDDDVWIAESQIFGDSEYGLNEWRLDFAKKVNISDFAVLDGSNQIESGISIEVAFNNAGSAAWNLVKPVIASELNHVKKNIQTSLGIVIAATEDLKKAGGFDSTVGTFEHYAKMLVPMRDIVSVPMLIIGLEAPKTFRIAQEIKNGKKYGRVEMIS
ncbi:MAG: hypothetical protein KGQ56_03230 [Acidobacteria bacterium]|nr:hypothetical protein [Acidobacteriota bacterium]